MLDKVFYACCVEDHEKPMSKKHLMSQILRKAKFQWRNERIKRAFNAGRVVRADMMGADDPAMGALVIDDEPLF